MSIRLFDIQNNKITPTEHCYTIKSLKVIMEKYPKDYLNIYAYLFYMTCLNEEDNPFANAQESDKEELILSEVGGKFSADDKLIIEALGVCFKLYDVPSYRLYRAAKKSLETLSTYLETVTIVDGNKDGNLMGILRAQKDFDDICRKVESRWKAFKEEQSTISRGGHTIAYDQ